MGDTLDATNLLWCSVGSLVGVLLLVLWLRPLSKRAAAAQKKAITEVTSPFAINYSRPFARRADSNAQDLPLTPVPGIGDDAHVEQIVEVIEEERRRTPPLQPTSGLDHVLGDDDVEVGIVKFASSPAQRRDDDGQQALAITPTRKTSAATTPYLCDEPLAKASDGEATWMVRVSHGACRVHRMPGSGEIETASYLAAVAPIPEVYEVLLSLQVVSGFMRRDFDGHVANVRRSMLKLPNGEGATLQGIVRYGMAHYDHGELARNPHSMVGSVLWLHRAVKFVTQFLRGLANGLASSQAAKDAYKDLRPYHNMMTAAFVSRALGLTPKRKNILQRLKIESEEAAHAQLCVLLEAMEPLVDTVERALEQLGANFSNRV